MKTRERVVCRSHLDRLFCVWAETEPGVTSYWRATEALATGRHGKRWLPDFGLVRTSERILVQLSRGACSDAAQFEARADAAREAGFAFLAVTLDELERQPQLDNRRLLLRARGHAVAVADRATLYGAVVPVGRELGQLSALLASPRPRDDVFALCLEGALTVVDLNWPISEQSVIAAGSGGRHE
jgi:hypothetical protein